MADQLMYFIAGAGGIVAALYYVRLVSTHLSGGPGNTSGRAEERPGELLEKCERHRNEQRRP